MAEYVDREKLIPDRCYYEPYGYEAVSCEQIFHEDTADVVERERYDCLQSENEMLWRQLHQTFVRGDELDKLNGDMREKIDNAIKEMERYSTFFEYANRHDLASAVDYCIGVIQENIGEK